MRKIVKHLFLWLFATIFLLNAGFSPQVVLAQGEALMISPSITEEVMQPGEVLTKTIHVVNESSSVRRIYPIVKDFISSGEDGSPRLIEPGSQEGAFLSSYLRIDEAEGVLINPGGSHDFSFTISMPQNAGPGGYYSALVFGTKAEDVRLNTPDKGAASAVSQQAASLLLVKIPGGANEKAEVKDFSTAKSFYGTPYKVNFLARIENLGNIHVAPRGVITVSNMFSKDVATVKLNDKGGSILPNSLRKYENSWQDKYGFGRYKAEMALSYGTPANAGGNGKQSLIATTFFWIIPWKIVMPIVIGLIVLLVLSYLSLKSYKERAIKKALRGVTASVTVGQRAVKQVKGGNVSNAQLNMLMFAILTLVGLLVLMVLILMFA